MNNIEERLSFFRSLVSCAHDITFTEFTSDLTPVFCSNKQADAIYLFFAIDELSSLEQMPDINKGISDSPFACAYPVVCTNSLGMVWISECEFENVDEAESAPISEGFVELNEHNNVVQGDFSEYKYIYKKESDTIFMLLSMERHMQLIRRLQIQN